MDPVLSCDERLVSASDLKNNKKDIVGSSTVYLYVLATSADAGSYIYSLYVTIFTRPGQMKLRLKQVVHQRTAMAHRLHTALLKFVLCLWIPQ